MGQSGVLWIGVLAGVFVAGAARADLTPLQSLRIEQISSIFENGTPDPQYDYIEDIGDGAGVTAGRIGFTTASHDLLEAVDIYVNERERAGASPADVPLAAYLPCLRAIVDTSDYACLFPSVPEAVRETADWRSNGIRLVDFGKAWVDAASDERMRETQNRLVRENVWEPAGERVRSLGLQTAFGTAVIFDSILQQGDDGTNGVEGMVRRTRRAYGDGPFDEARWLEVYLVQRRETLRYGYDENDVEHTVENPYESYPRADSLLEILHGASLDLTGIVKFTYFGETFELP
jgi:chitosanase